MALNISIQEYFKIIQYLYHQKKYIKYFSCTTQINLWKFNGMPEETTENITKSESNFAPTFFNYYAL